MKYLINKNNILKDKYLKDLLKEFWFAPNDAFLRAPEVAVWQTIKKTIKYPLLNVGCGDGRMDSFLFRGYRKHVGLDNDQIAVQRARKSCVYNKVVFSNAEDMPFKNDSFLTVISNSTFEHIKRDQLAVKEVFRVLKPGGVFIFNTTTNKLLYQLKKLGIIRKKLNKINTRLSHFHYHSLDEWQNLLKFNNFKIDGYLYYLPRENVKIWIKLYKIATFRPYKRELWSYLKDSPYGRLFPSKLISKFLYIILRRNYKKSFADGTWIFIKATKK